MDDGNRCVNNDTVPLCILIAYRLSFAFTESV